MIKNILKAQSISLASAVLVFTNAAHANENSVDYREIYFGADFGISEPVVKKFSYEDEEHNKTHLGMDNSRMYGGRIGYVFYPNMKVELAASSRPKYRISYTLPAIESMGIKKTKGKTTADAKIFNLRLIYSMSEQFYGIKPYVMFGVGLAQMSIKSTSSSADLPGNPTIFKVNKSNENCFSYQVGTGFTKDIVDNFSVDFGAKLYVVNNIKIKYDAFDMASSQMKTKDPIKKTIAVGEFTLGFAYKLPL